MSMPIYTVDAFTDRPFSGNPAAVCILDEPRDDRWMQSVAAEMNLSETAFLRPTQHGYALRWLTPTTEVDLCGHATLASAHVLWTEGYLAPGTQARFQTRSGLLTADRRGEWIEMDFPSTPVEPAQPAPGLLDAIGATPIYVGKARFDYFLELDSEATLRQLQPDLLRLRSIATRGVIVTSPPASSDYDFVSRFFAPGAGVNEDPVTGSAHCALAPFWADRLGKTEMVGYQASTRGGTVRVHLAADRVMLIGQAVTVLKGELI